MPTASEPKPAQPDDPRSEYLATFAVPNLDIKLCGRIRGENRQRFAVRQFQLVHKGQQNLFKDIGIEFGQYIDECLQTGGGETPANPRMIIDDSVKHSN